MLSHIPCFFLFLLSFFFFLTLNQEYCQLYSFCMTLVRIVQQAVFMSQYFSDFPGFSFPVVFGASPPGTFHSSIYLFVLFSEASGMIFRSMNF